MRTRQKRSALPRRRKNMGTAAPALVIRALRHLPIFSAFMIALLSTTACKHMVRDRMQYTLATDGMRRSVIEDLARGAMKEEVLERQVAACKESVCVFEDAMLHMVFRFEEDGFAMTISNDTASKLDVLWNYVGFLDELGNRDAVEQKPTLDEGHIRMPPQLPLEFAPGSSTTFVMHPSSKLHVVTEKFGNEGISWTVCPLRYLPQNIGGRFGIVMTVKIAGTYYNYVFPFEVRGKRIVGTMFDYDRYYERHRHFDRRGWQ
jgi:hypothetical protein